MPNDLFRRSNPHASRGYIPREEKIYVASSWRNNYQPAIVATLQAAGFPTYDFREPQPGKSGFSWSDISKRWMHWTTSEYIAALDTPIAKEGFGNDMTALRECDICILVLPCGRSAHLELGYAAGAGKKTAILCMTDAEPELMNKMVHHISPGVMDLLGWLGVED